jgi:hypothetical protein
MANSSVILYALKCEHAAPGPDTLVSGSLYCAWCKIEQQIAGVIEYEWRANCNDCPYMRYAGLSKHNAALFAQGHSRHAMTHTIVLEYARNPAATKTAEKMQKWNGRKPA